jgi:hypothetical protein
VYSQNLGSEAEKKRQLHLQNFKQKLNDMGEEKNFIKKNKRKLSVHSSIDDTHKQLGRLKKLQENT